MRRHGISKPLKEKTQNEKDTFKTSPLGYFHAGMAEVQTEEDRTRLFVAIDGTSKFAYAEPERGIPQKAAAYVAKKPL